MLSPIALRTRWDGRRAHWPNRSSVQIGHHVLVGWRRQSNDVRTRYTAIIVRGGVCKRRWRHCWLANVLNVEGLHINLWPKDALLARKTYCSTHVVLSTSLGRVVASQCLASVGRVSPTIENPHAHRIQTHTRTPSTCSHTHTARPHPRVFNSGWLIYHTCHMHREHAFNFVDRFLHLQSRKYLQNSSIINKHWFQLAHILSQITQHRFCEIPTTVLFALLTNNTATALYFNVKKHKRIWLLKTKCYNTSE